MPPATGSRRKAGCSFCRFRHMKCDNAQPACSNCAKRRQECVYDSALRIRLRTFKEDIEAAQEKRKETNLEQVRPTMYSAKYMIQDPLNMQLFEYFKDTVGCYMDVANDARHFSTSVVGLALTCPMLYYACLSYSAAVMKRTHKHLHDSIVQAEQHYLSECYRLLIPALNDKSCLNEPALLSTTVVLRAGEQFQHEDDPTQDPKYHLRGSASLVQNDRIWQLSGTGVREASFWTYIRQDIHSAVIEQKPCVYNNNNTLEFFSLGSDSIWTNRITFISARACNYVFGNRKSPQFRESIINQIHEWYQKLPSTFEPYHKSGQDGSQVFPVTVYLHPWHTCAMQYYYFALLLMKDGDGEESEYANARTLAGICLSASHVGLRLNSCHFLEFAAPYLQQPQEQLALMRFFSQISKETGWPTARTFNVLKRVWSSPPQEVVDYLV